MLTVLFVYDIALEFICMLIGEDVDKVDITFAKSICPVLPRKYVKTKKNTSVLHEKRTLHVCFPIYMYFKL